MGKEGVVSNRFDCHRIVLVVAFVVVVAFSLYTLFKQSRNIYIASIHLLLYILLVRYSPVHVRFHLHLPTFLLFFAYIASAPLFPFHVSIYYFCLVARRPCHAYLVCVCARALEDARAGTDDYYSIANCWIDLILYYSTTLLLLVLLLLLLLLLPAE